jgi:hypothetical protein
VQHLAVKSQTQRFTPFTLNNQSSFESELQTFIFSKLPQEEKKRFMDFLVENEVEFQEDPEGGYVATIRIFNQQLDQ